MVGMTASSLLTVAEMVASRVAEAEDAALDRPGHIADQQRFFSREARYKNRLEVRAKARLAIQFRMIFHLEASRRAMGLVQAIERAGMKPGIAINPETPAGAMEPILPYIDNVCMMGIAPGFAFAAR